MATEKQMIYMKTIKVTFLFFVFYFVCNCLQAQTKNRLPCIDKKISIVVHVVKDSLKNYGVFAPTSPATFTLQIQQAVDSLNAHFAPICVSFEVCEYRYIENYWYLNDISKSVYTAFKEMRVLYNAENRINIYYIQELGTGFYNYVENIITNINDGGIIMMSAKYNVLINSMGKYFGLLTTYNINDELVNGSNSATSGDFITDTPADPFIIGKDATTFVDKNCKFISMEKDANHQYYEPIVGNAMSFYYYDCICNSGFAFTHDQYAKMARTYLSNPVAW
jgi:hypothetical protein